ncbi:hypothetical protein TNCT_123131 [Trichonephila clavata]|uniref:Uncharacterized protein n=1 Tax=Trichonephila clavata TaxID=2740835 RepID=A0A8X6J7P5_TRICU|nr:hypothetical protein TNCT_123131 [Trichonephila clavata]
MAESAENAIPNLKNSQKRIVIVLINVHHRHDSQVRFLILTRHQILQKNLKVVHYHDGILQADNLNKSHAFVGLPCQDINATNKRTAERMRD